MQNFDLIGSLFLGESNVNCFQDEVCPMGLVMIQCELNVTLVVATQTCHEALISKCRGVITFVEEQSTPLSKY